MEDLLKAMFEQRVIKTMFDTGIMYSNDSWKTLFDKIAHSSIMKLNPTSMSRVYNYFFRFLDLDFLLRTSNNLDGLGFIVLKLCNIKHLFNALNCKH